MTEPTRLINRKTLLAMIPLSDRAIYDMEKRGDFPARIALTTLGSVLLIQLAQVAVGWRAML